MSNYFDRPEKLRQLRKRRAAYSDRTSSLLAEMCRLTYERLPIKETEVSLVAAILDSSKTEHPKETLAELVKGIAAAAPSIFKPTLN